MLTADCTIDALAFSAYGYGSCTPKFGHIKLNGATVWQGSWCGNIPDPRGVNILRVDPFICSVQETRRFDTHDSTSSARQLSEYLNQLSYGSLIVGVTADEATRELSGALLTLRELGVDVADVGFRGSFAFIAQKGYPDKTVLSKALTEEQSHTTQPHVNAVITGILSVVRSGITSNWNPRCISAIMFPTVGLWDVLVITVSDNNNNLVYWYTKIIWYTDEKLLFIFLYFIH